MKTWTVAAALLFLSCGSFAQSEAPAIAHKACDDLKAEIGKKLDAKGVVNYTLEIVEKGKPSDGKVVGSCDGGTKSIVYTRGAGSPKQAEEKKPQ